RPNLDLLGPEDRAVMVRALSMDPAGRYSCCGDFLRALEGYQAPPRNKDRKGECEPDRQVAPRLPSVIIWPAAPSLLTLPAAGGLSLDDILPELLSSAAGPLRVKEHKSIGFLLRPGESLEHDCAARLPPGVAGLKLSGFAQQWNAERLQQDANSFLF